MKGKLTAVVKSHREHSVFITEFIKLNLCVQVFLLNSLIAFILVKIMKMICVLYSLPLMV